MKAKVDRGLWFEPAVVHPGEVEEAYYFVFHRENILRPGAGDVWVPLDLQEWRRLGVTGCVEHYMGRWDGRHCFAVDLDQPLDDADFANLRAAHNESDERLFALAGRATQLIQWYKTHRYCGRCGVETRVHETDRARVCPDCDTHFYPRLSPSIIVLVRRGDEILLARNAHWPEGFYSTLAGFVEPGESVEQTLHREVREEVGIEIANPRYMGSQPWAFPNSLMIGYHADYLSGEISPQDGEIAEARWFHYSGLPSIPGKMAISRWLIDSFLVEKGVAV
jgi:NAD+ diphosphatase